MKNRNFVDKFKDGIYPFIKGVKNVAKNKETNQENINKDNRLVVGREPLEEVDDEGLVTDKYDNTPQNKAIIDKLEAKDNEERIRRSEAGSVNEYIENVEDFFGATENNIFEIDEDGWINRYLDFISEKYQTKGDNRGQDNRILEKDGKTGDIIPTKEVDNTSFSLEQRVSGDELLNAQDLIQDVKDVGAEVDDNGYVTVYHQTTNDNAKKIRESGEMYSNEPFVFFSTSKDAQQSQGRGKTKLEFKIPAEDLILDDLFSDNADVKVDLKGNKSLDVSGYLVDRVSLEQQLENQGKKYWNKLMQTLK